MLNNSNLWNQILYVSCVCCSDSCMLSSPATTTTPPCSDEYGYLCPNGQCIEKSDVCDGKCDCYDSCEDENRCSECHWVNEYTIHSGLLFGSHMHIETYVKEVRHIEMPKAAPQKSICHFQKLEMILK